MIAPVGHECWQGASSQCLHTSLIISQRLGGWSLVSSPNIFSLNATCRQVVALTCEVLSKLLPVKVRPSLGNWFHCLHATSQALQPMQRVVSVKNPMICATSRSGWGTSLLTGGKAL